MFYVYVLKLFKGTLYIGYTNNLERRIKEHVDGKSKYTSTRRPLKLVYYEAYFSEKDARERERKLKQFKQGCKHLKNRIQKSIDECQISEL
jgi:putative endonuclease